jgi:hypothetical protein
MSVVEWLAAPADVRAREFERRREENRREAVARAQAKSIRSGRRRQRLRNAWAWCRRNKMAFYPVGAVTAITFGFFTVGVLAGCITMGIGLVVLEWRFSR